MAIDRVVADVQYAVFIPFYRDRIEGRIGNFGWHGLPVETLGLTGPEAVGISDAFLIEPVIICCRAMGEGIGARRRDQRDQILVSCIVSHRSSLLFRRLFNIAFSAANINFVTTGFPAHVRSVRS